SAGAGSNSRTAPRATTAQANIARYLPELFCLRVRKRLGSSPSKIRPKPCTLRANRPVSSFIILPSLDVFVRSSLFRLEDRQHKRPEWGVQFCWMSHSVVMLVRSGAAGRKLENACKVSREGMGSPVEFVAPDAMMMSKVEVLDTGHM